MNIHFLGTISFDDCCQLQGRLVRQVLASDGETIHLLLCEHPKLITVGRGGSRSHIRASNQDLTSRRVAVQWIQRGGGCILHAPGQLAIYPIVPLERLGWSPGEFMRRFQAGLHTVLSELRVSVVTRPAAFGLWGRSGQLVAFGVNISHGVSRHGAFLNVNPAMSLMRRIQCQGNRATKVGEATAMSSLLAELGRGTKMTWVRSLAAESLATAFDRPSYDLHTSHPWLQQIQEEKRIRERAVRAS